METFWRRGSGRHERLPSVLWADLSWMDFILLPWTRMWGFSWLKRHLQSFLKKNPGKKGVYLNFCSQAQSFLQSEIEWLDLPQLITLWLCTSIFSSHSNTPFHQQPIATTSSLPGNWKCWGFRNRLHLEFLVVNDWFLWSPSLRGWLGGYSITQRQWQEVKQCGFGSVLVAQQGLKRDASHWAL